MNVDIPRIFRPLLKEAIWIKHPSSKLIYLTFDDGPIPEVTPQVLDILDKYNWKATFFCVGENVLKYPNLYEKIRSNGHAIGNHTFNHLKAFRCSADDYISNIRKAEKFIHSTLFRPPYGQISNRLIKRLKAMGYQTIMWDVLTHDYNQELQPNTILNQIKKQERSGSIVVFHDSIKAQNNILEVLPLALEFWQSKGYKPGLL